MNTAIITNELQKIIHKITRYQKGVEQPYEEDEFLDTVIKEIKNVQQIIEEYETLNHS